MNRPTFRYLLALAALIHLPAADTVRAADEQAEPNDKQVVTLKVVDAEGRPVAGAQVGFYVAWEEDGKPRVVGFAESGDADKTDEAGELPLSKDSIDKRSYGRDSLAVCGVDVDRKLIGLVKISKDDLGASKEVTLAPACIVEGTIESSELADLKQELKWTACYAYWGEHRPFFSDSSNGRVHFWLPPGDYELNVYGTHLVTSDKPELTIAEGQREASFEADLPASNLAKLIGRPAPELESIKAWKNSEPLSLDQLQGKVVVLEFWGYWCGPCVHSMPELMKLHDEFHDDGLEVIAVHDASVKSVEEMDEKLEEARKELWDGKDLPFPVAIDGRESDEGGDHGATTKLYGIRSWPTAILIDRQGEVVGEFPYRSDSGRTMLLAALGVEDRKSNEDSTSTGDPPATKKESVTDSYHGTQVTEDYRWLEDGKNSEVKGWSDAQNVYARSILDNLPGVERIRAAVTKIMSAEEVAYFEVTHRDGKFFAMKDQPPKQQPFLIVTQSATDLSKERVLVDPNAIDSSGGTSMNWYKPSADGKLVAVALSKGGDEVGDVHVYDVATGKTVGEVIPRVNTGTAGGDLAWSPDGSGFFYTRHPREGERPAEDMNFYQQVYYHKLDTPTADDRYELGKDSPRIAETELEMDDATGRLLATVQNGDGGEFAHYLRGKNGKWRQFSKFPDKIIMARFGPHDDLYVVSRQGAPRGKLLRVPIETLDVAGAQVVVPEGEDSIVTAFWRDSTVVPTASRVYVVYQLGGPSEIRAFDLYGKALPNPPQLPVSSVGHIERLTGDNVLFDNGSFIKPSAVYRYDAKSGQAERTALAVNEPVNLDDAEVVREFAVSKDGTKVPVNIIFKKGTKRDGKNPCLATAYGGYGVNNSPAFKPLNRILLDHGFVYALANVRGGGEYGEAWHLEGNLTKKQNVFDDFDAALQHLVKQGYTSQDRLAIIGGSNGGLLMGATLTQHPDHMKTVVSLVGIYDMLRVELSPNGAFNVTEFGTVKNEDHFRALLAYSPYHNVKDGVDYPPTLFLTGENDPRVEPSQSRKMTARLQAANPDGTYLLRTSADSGHGLDTPLTERIAQQTDIFAFIFDQLGVPF
jgi:prolyl oligopeptidase